jgi:hypothetical protein
VRRQGELVWGDGYNDSELPDGVAAIWLHLSYLMPSLAIVVATFTFSNEGSDLSPLLRCDYQTRISDVRVHVNGRFGKLRARLPWSRPKNWSMISSMSRAFDEKHRAFEQAINERQAACSRWFASRFPGRFAQADSSARPVIRLIFTEREVPFRGQNSWFRPIALDSSPTVYRSVDIPGWAVKDRRWPYAEGRFILTFAARRRDAARKATEDDSGEENWYLTQHFSTEQATLVARYAIHALLTLYSERLAKLRDSARIRKGFRRPVHDDRALNNYLTTDGLDAATVTSDIAMLTKDTHAFGRGIPEYIEDQEDIPEALKRKSPLNLVPDLCSLLRNQAARLANDIENTTGNLRSSAELRQAIASTRLERVIMLVSLAALIVAVVGIFLG